MSLPDELEVAELRRQIVEANQHIGALELTVYKQQQQLDLFQGQLRKIWSQLLGAAGDDGAALATDPRDDIPPHY